MTPRTIVRRDEAVSPPADGSKPCPRADNRRRARHWRDGFPPPVEPRRRRAGIQSAFSRGVLLTISRIRDPKAGRPRGAARPCEDFPRCASPAACRASDAALLPDRALQPPEPGEPTP